MLNDRSEDEEHKTGYRNLYLYSTHHLTNSSGQQHPHPVLPTSAYKDGTTLRHSTNRKEGYNMLVLIHRPHHLINSSGQQLPHPILPTSADKDGTILRHSINREEGYAMLVPIHRTYQFGPEGRAAALIPAPDLHINTRWIQLTCKQQ